ncbi:MAG: diacylglycerol kinase [Fusobacteriaceae bacterium]
MKKNKITGQDYDVVNSFNYAIDGIFEAIRTERHMKFHSFVTIIAIMIALFTDISKQEVLALAISISLVWTAELFNSAVEAVVDLVTDKYHPLAKRAKDIAAGATLITGINALIVGYIIFEDKIQFYLKNNFLAVKNSLQNTLVLMMVIVVVTVIIIKKYFKKGSPLRGGLPSGHSALGGAAFTSIAFLTNNTKVFYLAFILLILVLQSRVEGKIHTVKETILGAMLGSGIAYMAMKIIGF